jgi:hypothetical protein
VYFDSNLLIPSCEIDGADALDSKRVEVATAAGTSDNNDCGAVWFDVDRDPRYTTTANRVAITSRSVL